MRDYKGKRTNLLQDARYLRELGSLLSQARRLPAAARDKTRLIAGLQKHIQAVNNKRRQ